METLTAISTTTLPQCLHFNFLYFINLSGIVHCVAWQINLPFSGTVSVREIVDCASHDTALTLSFPFIMHKFRIRLYGTCDKLARSLSLISLPDCVYVCTCACVFVCGGAEYPTSTPDSETIILDRKSKALGPH